MPIGGYLADALPALSLDGVLKPAVNANRRALAELRASRRTKSVVRYFAF
jgi:hypothetical protein